MRGASSQEDGAAQAASTWVSRTPLALLQDQLSGLDAWCTAMSACMARELESGRTAASPEVGLGATRRLQTLTRERTAVLVRADDQNTEQPYDVGPEPRAVIAHRSAWFRSTITARLSEHGIRVVAGVDDGVSAFAAVLLDQPDLLLVEGALPLLRGPEVIDRVERFAPNTLVGALAVGPYELQTLLDAGARAVFRRSAAPADIADQLTACLLSNRQVAGGGEGLGIRGAEHLHPAAFERLLEGGRSLVGASAPGDCVAAGAVASSPRPAPRRGPPDVESATPCSGNAGPGSGSRC